MDAVSALVRLGGVGSAAEIVGLSSRRQLRSAVRRGELFRVARGGYVLPGGPAALQKARAHSAVVSHLSAAQHHGWKLKCPPEQLWLTVPRNRKVAGELAATCTVAYADLDRADVSGGVTTPLRTVLDCARRLPFDEALAVADSALRAGDVTRGELLAAASRLRGPGSAAARRVAEEADPLAANPFESVLRAQALEAGLRVQPQLAVGARGAVYHPDLVDRRMRLVIEADSFEFHTTREAHAEDCVRYTALTIAGWRVIRFSWEQVMHSPAYVRSVLRDVVAELAA